MKIWRTDFWTQWVGGVERVGQMEKRALTKMSFVKKKKKFEPLAP